jgi:GT2 family glycosyltransferase
MKSVSVVIPAYNGRTLLEKYLPPLLAASKKCRVPVEIIVVDDASSDETVSYLAGCYPEITLLVNDNNIGFAATMNRGIAAATGDVLLALNTDMAVGDDLFDKPLDRFADPEVFSVTPNLVYPHNGRSQSLTRLRTGFCWFRAVELQLADLPTLEGEIPIFFGSGGASFYDREKLLRLGGFDTVYHPFYIEDIDLSYRAWKSGWKCLFEPTVTVYHESNATIKSHYWKRMIKTVSDRNRILFMWLNVTDWGLILRYFLFLPLSLVKDILFVRKYKFVGFFWALKYLPRVPAARRNRKVYFRLSDREVFRKIS